MRNHTLRSALIPVALLVLLIAAAVFHTRLIKHPPEIVSLSPAATFPGNPLTINGKNFGEKRGDSEVVIAGIRATSSHFIEWNDTRIRLRVPHGVKSGRVYVRTNDGKSNGALFTNKSHIPVILSGPAEPGQPYIESISPEKGAVGAEVSITGTNFGRRRGNGNVFFRFLLGDAGTSKGKEDALSRVNCSEIDYDYLLWSDQEIRVYVPDGAVSGNVMVETDRGMSNAVYFEVAGPSGTKRFERKKGYQIQHEITIRNLDAGGEGGGIEVWVPRLTEGYTQQSIEESHSPEPMWQDYQGVMRYHVSEPADVEEAVLSHTYWFERYSVSTDISPSSLPSSYDTDRELYRRYTRPGSFIPSDEGYFRDLAARVTRGEMSPYAKAKAIYEYLIEALEVDSSSRGSLEEAIESGSCTASDYGLLFVILARAADIPARPNAGYLVFGDKLTRTHTWAEFYLPHYGWVPTDPALGDGIGYISMPVDDPRSFYFGNMDNQHITFSRHVVEIPKVNPHSRTREISRSFSLQTVWEEYQPDIEDYSSRWSDLRVIDWW